MQSKDGPVRATCQRRHIFLIFWYRDCGQVRRGCSDVAEQQPKPNFGIPDRLRPKWRIGCGRCSGTSSGTLEMSRLEATDTPRGRSGGSSHRGATVRRDRGTVSHPARHGARRRESPGTTAPTYAAANDAGYGNAVDDGWFRQSILGDFCHVQNRSRVRVAVVRCVMGLIESSLRA